MSPALLTLLRRPTRGRTTAVFLQHWTREAVKTYSICFVYHTSWWPRGADLGALLKTSRTPHSHFHTRACSHTRSHFTITRQGGETTGDSGSESKLGLGSLPGPVRLDTCPRARVSVGKGSLGSQPHSPNHQSGLVASRKGVPSITSDPAPVAYLEMRRSLSGQVHLGNRNSAETNPNHTKAPQRLRSPAPSIEVQVPGCRP